MTLELYRLANALGGFLQGERYVAPHIAALSHPPSTATSSTPTKQVPKNIAERRKNVFHVRKSTASRLAIDAGMPMAVVTLSFVGIVENLKRFGGFFESFNRLVVARIFVGMILDRKLTIRSCNLAVRSGLRDFKYFVIAAFFGHLQFRNESNYPKGVSCPRYPKGVSYHSPGLHAEQATLGEVTITRGYPERVKQSQLG